MTISRLLAGNVMGQLRLTQWCIPIPTLPIILIGAFREMHQNIHQQLYLYKEVPLHQAMHARSRNVPQQHSCVVHTVLNMDVGCAKGCVWQKAVYYVNCSILLYFYTSIYSALIMPETIFNAYGLCLKTSECLDTGIVMITVLESTIADHNLERC